MASAPTSLRLAGSRAAGAGRPAALLVSGRPLLAAALWLVLLAPTAAHKLCAMWRDVETTRTHRSCHVEFRRRLRDSAR